MKIDFKHSFDCGKCSYSKQRGLKGIIMLLGSVYIKWNVSQRVNCSNFDIIVLMEATELIKGESKIHAFENKVYES